MKSARFGCRSGDDSPSCSFERSILHGALRNVDTGELDACEDHQKKYRCNDRELNGSRTQSLFLLVILHGLIFQKRDAGRGGEEAQFDLT